MKQITYDTPANEVSCILWENTKETPEELKDEWKYRQKYMKKSGLILNPFVVEPGQYYLVDVKDGYITAVIDLIKQGKINYRLDLEAINEYLTYKQASHNNLELMRTKTAFYDLPFGDRFATFNNMFIEDLTQEQDNEVWEQVMNYLKIVIRDIKRANPGLIPVSIRVDEVWYQEEPVNPDPTIFSIKKHKTK